MKRIGIKYCGGCNPSYERVEIVQRAKSQLNHQFHFVHHDQPDIDAVILICGCQRACAAQDLNRTMNHYSVTGENDFESLMEWLKSLAAKGEG
jgi:4-hydroxybutyrate CoA-transferase